ncbi:tRNA (N6-isopentenyl adenosine(37)-C2)-methylthiotransferase MiaB [Iodidimonas sp. SYSU 1G8]|uniref:tRNA (N6-isopentenyl adenosine(37)-C2)-methylthiotransferase MiaB n=1 Tax=Iodidimonas sp. SYSU 1G8 TaxID=3133967 RepID=UPI0031FE91E8
MAKKRLHIKTYGCQMNVYDSARMADILAPLGYETTEAPDDADLVILNTCHIREKAAEKVYSEVGRLRLLKEEKARSGGRMLVAVGGCVAQAQGEEMMRRAPSIDLVFGPQTYHDLPDLLGRATRDLMMTGRSRVVSVDLSTDIKFDKLPEEAAPQGVSAFLTIQEGCDKFCSFCVVPYTRGAEYSRPMADVLAEAARMVRLGTVDITLLGQNVNAYHGDNGHGGTAGLGELMRRLADIDGLERIRYTTSHPRDVDDDLIAAHRDVPQIMPFLHLPVQSGSDRILTAMNRRHTAARYRDIVARLRDARPDLALSSDFIVGYPGETDADFQATMDLVRDVRYSMAYSFKYSPRPGTPAADLDDQVPESVKSERLAILQAELLRQQEEFNAACVGRILPVLLERDGRHPGQLVGRSPYMQAVSVDAGSAQGDLRGTIHNVEIGAVLSNSLRGRLIGPATLVAAQ